MNDNLFGLTEREILVLIYSLKGISNDDMAKKLCISNASIKAHIHHLLEKTETRNKLELMSKIYCMLLDLELEDVGVLVENLIRR